MTKKMTPEQIDEIKTWNEEIRVNAFRQDIRALLAHIEALEAELKLRETAHDSDIEIYRWKHREDCKKVKALEADIRRLEKDCKDWVDCHDDWQRQFSEKESHLQTARKALEAINRERLHISDMMCDSDDDYGYLGSDLWITVNNALAQLGRA